MLVRRLQDLGFTEKEAKIYVGLLELGEATAQDLATKAGINRATTYVTLESLLKRKFVNKIEKDKKAMFTIEHPLQILEFLEHEKNNVEIKINLAKKMLPELEMLEKVTGEKAKVKLYEGKDGVIMIQKEILHASPKFVDEIFNINSAVKEFPPSKNDHRQALNKKKIQRRMIAVYNPKEPIPNLPLINGTLVRYLPENKVPFNAELVMYDDKAVLLSVEGKFMALVVQNLSIVNGLKFLFELAWQGADKYLNLSEINKKL
jgi:sugar-specific transcriptional regulator TrmB